MPNLSLVKSDNFNGVRCDFYKGQEVWMTRRQIGESLGYSNPTASIRNIHNRNKDRLDKYSTRTKVIRVEGDREVEREVFLYSRKGVFEVCRWSQQDRADDFIDWVWEVVDEIMRTGSYSVGQANQFDVLRNMVDNLEETRKIAEQAKNEVAAVKDTFAQIDENWRDYVNSVFTRIGRKTGDYSSYRNKSYEQLNIRARCNIQRRLDNKVERMKKAGASKTATQNTRLLDVIEDDARLVEIYVSIVKEFGAKYL